MFRTVIALLLILRAPVLSANARQSTVGGIDPDAINDTSERPGVLQTQSKSAVVRAQILLCRANFSPGEIDGTARNNFRQAAIGFQKAHGLPATGKVDAATWKQLLTSTVPILTTYTISSEDAAGPFEKIPTDMMEKSKLQKLGYESALEGLAEKYHASPDLLRKLNPGKTFDQAGVEIRVPNIAKDPPGKAASIRVSKRDGVVAALGADGKVLAQYPATIGSEHDPLPLGSWKVTVVKKDPPFFYNPDLFWDAEAGDSKAKIAPGPNNPVGSVWIGLSKEHYGIHGTPEPSTIGHAESHGCIRLTNWDALELAGMVSPKTPVELTE